MKRRVEENFAHQRAVIEATGAHCISGDTGLPDGMTRTSPAAILQQAGIAHVRSL